LGGESRAKKRAHAAILARNPNCIYCGGDVPATTIDHVPPKIMFREKRRPKGLEFPSCETCNRGTKHADLVAAMIGRSYPSGSSAPEEMSRIFQAIKNNMPNVLLEMHIGDTRRSQIKRSLPSEALGEPLRVSGPFVSTYMQTFAFKIGIALHTRITGEILPRGGSVAARWFSNVDNWRGHFPDLSSLPLSIDTLRQGTFEVADQFSYQWGATSDHSMTISASYFRHSFAVVAFTAVDKAKLDVPTNFPIRLCSPGELTKAIEALPA